MASEGSPEGPSKGGTSPSPTDLKVIVNDSLRELLRDEPALFARKSERGPTGTSGGDAPGGKYHDCSQERSVSQSRPPRRPLTATWRGCAVEAQRRAFHLSARGRPRGGGVLAGLEADLMASLPPWRPWTAARRGCCWHLPISGRRDGSISPLTGSGLGAMPGAERLGLKVTGADDPEGGGGGDANVGGETGGVGTTAAREASTSKGVASEGLPPVPHKLVLRVLRGEYVELLRDNLEAQRRSSSQQTSSLSSEPSSSRSRREVPDLLSWVQCFCTYVAIVTSKKPEKMRQLLAYQTLIVREARRCGGKGWLAYDSYFRQ